MELLKKGIALLCASILMLTAVEAEQLPEQGNPPAPAVEDGDYFLLGKYNEEPILWKCVDTEDENGILLLSDKIICFKAFDAMIGEFGDENRIAATNVWEESNIRAWLNSTAPAGKVEWPRGIPPVKENILYGDPYDQEKGFLAEGNFTEEERSLMKPVSQWVYVPEWRQDLTTNGVSEVVEQVTFDVSNPQYERRYYDNSLNDYPGYPYAGSMCQVTDTMFFLSIHQVSRLYEKYGNIGAEPVEAIKGKYEQYIDSLPMEVQLTNDLSIRYWLRDPLTSFECSVWTGGNKNKTEVFPNTGYIGVRPAFILNTDQIQSYTGSGTEEDPYILTGENPSIISVFCNGSEIFFDQQPVMENDHVLVPMRGIFEALGAEITWDGETQTVTAVRGDCTIEVQIGSSVMLKNGEPVELDVVPKIENDRTLVPIRAVSEGLDAKVDWNAELQQVIVDTQE